MLGAAICVSLLEGAWVWILVAALSEVAGQIPPSPLFTGLLLFAGWISARALELKNVDLVLRRRILVIGGLTVALLAGTVHAGLVLPTQLVLGRPVPDLRGAGVTLVLLSAYLWGRGLALARGIDRDRVGNHVTVSAGGLILTLLLLPLTTTVQRDGVLVVAISFLLGTASLAFLQIAGTESRRLTPLQWGALVAAVSALLTGVSAVVSGAVSFAGLDGVRRLFASAARAVSPVTDAMFLAAGHLAEYLTYLLRALAELFGADEAFVRRAMERAEQERPQIEEFDPGSPPEIMTLTVAFFLSALTFAIIIWAFGRLIGQRRSRDALISRQRIRIGGANPLGSFRAALGHLWRRDDEGPVPSDARAAIRHHYRRFQTLMARADLPRGPSQTPQEYERTLRGAVAGADDRLAAITDAYVLARYAPDDARLPPPEIVGKAVDELRAVLRAATPATAGPAA
jgi:hypothetical protein